MKHPNEPKSEQSWITLAELGRVLDVTEKATRDVLRYVPEKWVKRGKPTRVYGRGAVLLWAARQEGEPREDADGIASPALERKREVECQLKLLDLAERESELVPRSRMRHLVFGMAVILRRAGDLLVRKYGNEAGEILQESLGEIKRLTDADGLAEDGDGACST